MDKWGDLEKGEWPAPTAPVEKPPVYRWEIAHGTKTKEIITSDIAGEAWRKFIVDQVNSTEEKDTKSILDSIKKQWDSLPQKLSPQVLQTHITTVENMLKSASGIVLLLDLKKIINKEQEYEQAMYLPTALQKYMKQIHRQHVPITLVLSKVDEYEYTRIDEENNTPEKKNRRWEDVIEEYVPWMPQFKKIIPVSAVSTTKNTKPAPGFKSEGLTELCENIWGITSSADQREWKWVVLKFGYIDTPILLFLFLFYLLLVIISPIALICRIFFWGSFSVYLLFKIYRFVTKRR